MKMMSKTMIFLAFLHIFHPVFVKGDSDCCGDWYHFLQAAIKKFVEPKYQDFKCLDRAILGAWKGCKRETFLLPLNSVNCQKYRKIKDDEDDELLPTNTRELKEALTKHSINAEALCDILHIFNKISLAHRTKAMYAYVYNASAVYFPYAFTDKYDACDAAEGAVILRRCILDANKAVHEFFGMYSLPKWNDTKCR